MHTSIANTLIEPRGAVPRARAAQCGFTLVEVLVALMVLSIGLLGVAKLTMSAVKANDSAYMRAQATQLAYAIIDQMRANRITSEQGGYNYAGGIGAPAAGSCMTASCPGAVLAQLDLFNWQTRLAAALPAGQGTVATALLPGGNGETLATVTVSWNDSLAQWAFGTPSSTNPAAMSIQVQTIL